MLGGRTGCGFLTFLLMLDSHSEEFCDERCLSCTVPFLCSLHLSLWHPLWSVISLQCSPSRLERKEAHPRFYQSFDKAMVLFDQIIEIFVLSEFTSLRKNP